MKKEEFLDIVASCVATLPHKVEWFEDDNMRNKVTEMQSVFILPSNVIDALGGSAVLYDPCEKIAGRYQCKFYKANDGSFVFKR